MNAIFLPGVGCTAEVWADALPGGCRAIELPDGETVDAMAQAVLDSAPQRFSLAGFSLGGYVALAIAALSPGRIERLALVSSGARADSPEAGANRERLIALALNGSYASLDERLTPFVLHPDRQDDARIRELRRRMSAECGPQRYVSQQRAAGARPDRMATLAGLRVPVLLAVGEEDRITPPAWSKEMARAAPGARLALFERCGHMAPLERPEALARELRQWLGQGGGS
jgi:pimeloyl-ACP methyl ester carboxylesterase